MDTSFKNQGFERMVPEPPPAAARKRMPRKWKRILWILAGIPVAIYLLGALASNLSQRALWASDNPAIMAYEIQQKTEALKVICADLRNALSIDEATERMGGRPTNLVSDQELVNECSGAGY